MMSAASSTTLHFATITARLIAKCSRSLKTGLAPVLAVDVISTTFSAPKVSRQARTTLADRVTPTVARSRRHSNLPVEVPLVGLATSPPTLAAAHPDTVAVPVAASAASLGT